MFSAGNMSGEEVLAELQQLSDTLPSNRLSPRFETAFKGEFPKWKDGGLTQIKTTFASSIVAVLFPLPKDQTKEQNFFRSIFLGHLFGWGEMTSPLMKIVREERHLVYGVDTFKWLINGSGFFGFITEAKSANITPIIQALRETLRHPSVCSSDHIEAIKEGLLGSIEMKTINPSGLVKEAISDVNSSGRVVNDEEYCEILRNYSVAKAKDLVAELREEQAHVIIYEGEGPQE